MCSVWSSSSFWLITPLPKHTHKSLGFWILPHLKRKSSFPSTPISSSLRNNDSPSSAQISPLGYDPEELLGITVDLQPRKTSSKPRSWFGPNGQYIRELPCPSCRGRGYTPCAECGIERPRPDCSLCTAKGIVVCDQCNGDCVIWEESIDERPWQKAQSVSPLKVKEDDEVDDLEIKLDVKKKKKLVHQSPPEVKLKISRALKSLNAKTGLFSKKMKLLHQDPILRAQRIAAIKKTKGTAEARKHASETMKQYFSNPENRHKRSMAMKGIRFRCQNCGGEGHRRYYCPEVPKKDHDRRFRCRICGIKGHNRRTCPRSKPISTKCTLHRDHHCKICGQLGHNRRTCSKKAGVEEVAAIISKRSYTCQICQQKGHSMRTCPFKNRHSESDIVQPFL